MTEPRDELAGAFHRLRGEISARVPAPPAAGLRARATHRLRVRRATTALVAALAVIVIAGGGNALLRPTAGPQPPVDLPGPNRPPEPTQLPEPTPLLPLPPDPRPTPQEPAPLDDPIAEVDWGSATITVPPRDGCPTEPVRLTPVSDIFPNGIGPADGFPKLTLDATGAGYGDLTGDGQAEAVVLAGCASSGEALSSGHDGSRLLAVARQDDGTLTGLAWVGPAGADFHSWWLVGDRLLIDADPWVVSAEDHFPRLPGLALSYRWQGSGFDDAWEPAPEYPPVLPLDGEGPGAPVQPRPAVSSALGCPDAELRFAQTGGGWIAAAPGASYTIPVRPHQPFLFDLDRTGQRLLVVGLFCTRTDGVTQHGLAVFEPAGDGWQGISVLRHPAGYQPGSWRMDGELVAVEWVEPGGRVQPPKTFRWNGTYLEPTSG